MRGAALAAAAALVLTACGDAPEDEPTTTADPGTETTDSPSPAGDAADFKGCIISDEGGFDDQSFNQAGYEGLMQARDDLGIETAEAESTAATDFGPNIDSMIGQDCDLIFTVGFLLADATRDAAELNPDVNFAIIDDASIEADNVKPIVFDTAQAAFLAGYLAAGYSESGTVATFGGMPIPPVTIFMDGFVDGVDHYNEVKGTDVRVLGCDKDSQTGALVGNFSDIAAGQNLARSFIDSGADVIMPVAGPVGGGAASAAQEAGITFIGVDSDWFETAPEYADVILTSVLKQMGPAVFDVVEGALEEGFDAEAYVGTLENEGVALAPFHDFDAQVDADLKSEIEALRQSIIDGEVEVDSPASPSTEG